MFVKILKHFVILQLILVPLLVNASNVRSRRRPGLRTEATAIEEVTEKAAGGDQIAMASQTESTRYAIPSSYSTASDQETENYPYELNLVRPESQYQTNPVGVSHYSFGNEDPDLDNVETAEEYVAKAMQMYGARLKEPALRINAEPLPSKHINKYDVFEEPEPEPETQTSAPLAIAAPVFDKDPVTRSYDVYDYSTFETVSEQQYEPKYDTKYRYQPTAVESAYVAPQRSNERITSAASSEIPKEEILKQIEKSVMKYMKEMEAEGKIIPTPEPKTTYYQLQPVEPTVRVQTTQKPKLSFHYATTNRSHMPKITPKPTAVVNEEPYQSSTLQQELSESLAPNVEFIYKIKARAPLQSVQPSRPYQSQGKVPTETFDHTAALKNMEEFDLSHVVQEERPSNKPKLFFNSEIYHDINSLPYKPEKLGHQRPQQKLKEHADYKGYALFTEAKNEEDNEDAGYPIMNPYQFIFKKEPSSTALVAQPSSNWENAHSRPYVAPQKTPVEYDTYSPKYNNNPEGYGYQQHQYAQNHKYQGRHPTKRGKRGGAHPHNKKGGSRVAAALTKDVEANVALRPPPKV